VLRRYSSGALLNPLLGIRHQNPTFSSLTPPPDASQLQFSLHISLPGSHEQDVFVPAISKKLYIIDRFDITARLRLRWFTTARAITSTETRKYNYDTDIQIRIINAVGLSVSQYNGASQISSVPMLSSAEFQRHRRNQLYRPVLPRFSALREELLLALEPPSAAEMSVAAMPGGIQRSGPSHVALCEFCQDFINRMAYTPRWEKFLGLIENFERVLVQLRIDRMRDALGIFRRSRFQSAEDLVSRASSGCPLCQVVLQRFSSIKDWQVMYPFFTFFCHIDVNRFSVDYDEFSIVADGGVPDWHLDLLAVKTEST
jgi:hypothetical protein